MDATQAKPESKMSKARALYQQLVEEGAPEGRSIRQEFIARSQVEVGLTKSGAITYYNNLNNEAKGKPLYQYINRKPSTGGEGADDAPSEGGAKTAEESQAEESTPLADEEATQVDDESTAQ